MKIISILLITLISTGAQAKGILEAGYGYHFCNCMPNGSGMKSSSGIAEDSFENMYGVDVSTKPNPADDWVAFNYTLPSIDSEGVITITDISGKVITIMTIVGKQGQKIWDCRKTESGVYFYSINAGGKTVTGKIVITH